MKKIEKVVEPKSGESQDEFVSRCMSEEESNFPDQKQRLAVCFSKFRGSIEKQENEEDIDGAVIDFVTTMSGEPPHFHNGKVINGLGQTDKITASDSGNPPPDHIHGIVKGKISKAGTDNHLHKFQYDESIVKKLIKKIISFSNRLISPTGEVELEGENQEMQDITTPLDQKPIEIITSETKRKV